MPRFSAFTGGSRFRFSSRKSAGQLVFEDMVKNLGGEDNLSSDFDGPAMATLYAKAMAFSRVRLSLERAGRQFRPDRVLELLPALEAENNLVPEEGDSIDDRRAQLAGALKIARGAKRSNVEASLENLLGADFVSYQPTALADIVLSPSSSPEDVGIYDTPGTPRGVFRILASVLALGTPVTLPYEAVLSEGTGLVVGQKVLIDAASNTRREVVVVTEVTDVDGALTFTAVYTKPHTANQLVATGRMPTQVTSKRHNLVTMSAAGVIDRRKRRIANRALERLLRGISTWSLADNSGPFRVGVGRLGITTIGTT